MGEADQPAQIRLGTSSLLEATASLTDPQRELHEGLRSALAELGVRDADEETFLILRYAAMLTPDDARPEISTTRLFAGVIETARQLKRSQFYPGVLAAVIERDEKLMSSYDKILQLFRTDSAERALVRLRPRWFSRNSTAILESAQRARGNAPFSEAIARTLLTYRNGLLYGRISMDELARALPSPDIFQQIDQITSSLQILVTPRVRELLLYATDLRSPNELVTAAHLYRALRNAGAAREPIRPSDPSAMFDAAARAIEEPQNERPSAS